VADKQWGTVKLVVKTAEKLVQKKELDGI